METERRTLMLADEFSEAFRGQPARTSLDVLGLMKLLYGLRPWHLTSDSLRAAVHRAHDQLNGLEVPRHWHPLTTELDNGATTPISFSTFFTFERDHFEPKHHVADVFTESSAQPVVTTTETLMGQCMWLDLALLVLGPAVKVTLPPSPITQLMMQSWASFTLLVAVLQSLWLSFLWFSCIQTMSRSVLTGITRILLVMA